MADFAPLAALQELDTAADQLGHKLQRLPEREAVASVERELAAQRASRKAATGRAEAATAEVESLETAGHARDTKKARLNQQLKTVIAPREAEALLHEISLLDDERSAADDRELELLDVIEAAEAECAELDASLAATEARRAQAADELTTVAAALDAERSELIAQRETAAVGVDAGLLARYERLRSSNGGVAVARLTHGRCSGCHLDMSRTFVDQLRTHAGAEPLECEQCGRWLVP